MFKLICLLAIVVAAAALPVDENQSDLKEQVQQLKTSPDALNPIAPQLGGAQLVASEVQESDEAGKESLEGADTWGFYKHYGLGYPRYYGGWSGPRYYGGWNYPRYYSGWGNYYW